MSVWATASTADGRTYYYHTQTKQTRWDKPEDFDAAPGTPTTPVAPQSADSAATDAAWKEAKAADGRPYYYNAITRETKWEAPEGFLRQQQQQPPQSARSAAPAFVAGGGFQDRRPERRDEREHHLPQKPAFDGGRGGGQPWEARHDNAGFRGAMPPKTDEPEFGTPEQAEEAFMKLLRRSNIRADATWEDAMRKVIRERDFRAIKDPKDRQSAFEKYCAETRAEEKSKEKERRERVREEFRQMLKTHDEIKHYTRWKTARPMLEGEVIFKSAVDDGERRQLFDEYLIELKKRHAQESEAKRLEAKAGLRNLLQAMSLPSDTAWNHARERINSNEHFVSDDTYRVLRDPDIFSAFDAHAKALEQVEIAKRNQEQRALYREDRKARDAFKQLLQEKANEGKLTDTTKWQQFYPLVAQDGRFLGLLDKPGSTPLDLFRDAVEMENRRLRSKRNLAMDVLDDQRYEMTPETTIDDFAKLMRLDNRTAKFNPATLQSVYERIMEKVMKRLKDDKIRAEKDQRAAIDDLRSVIKHLEPPVRASDSYEDIVPRLLRYKEYQALNDDEARRAAFEKHIRRLRERETEDAERERPRRERDRRDRRHRTRTRSPEIDAYEAERRKFQEDRERQHRKASFGLEPSPRDRAYRPDDRYDNRDRDSRRAPDRDSVYDRERREREVERQRNYVSRADPRDKGRTLDYGDEDTPSSRPGSVRKRQDSEASGNSRRDTKRPRHAPTKTPEVEATLKEEPPALQSGSEEGEIEEV